MNGRRRERRRDIVGIVDLEVSTVDALIPRGQLPVHLDLRNLVLEHRRLPWWDAPAGACGTRATAAGALVCIGGVALVMLAKNGLADVAGWTALGGFVAFALTTGRRAV